MRTLNKLSISTLLFGIALAFSACVPRVERSITKRYQPVNGVPITVYDKPTDVPVDYEVLGKLEANCIKEITNCDSTSLLNILKAETHKIGGNALLIDSYKKPSWKTNSLYALKAKPLMVFDFSSPRDSLYTKRHIKLPRRYAKGSFDLRLSLPYVNQFTINTENDGVRSSFGFLGTLIGFDYYHSDGQYLSLIAGAGMDFLAPFPAPVTYDSGAFNFTESLYFGLTNNHHLNRFTCGYGLSFSRDFWSRQYYGDQEYVDEHYDGVLPDDKRFIGNNIGLMFTGYYNFTESFGVGIIYRPNLITSGTKTEFRYGHMISIDAAWKIRLKTGR